MKTWVKRKGSMSQYGQEDNGKKDWPDRIRGHMSQQNTEDRTGSQFSNSNPQQVAYITANGKQQGMQDLGKQGGKEALTCVKRIVS